MPGGDGGGDGTPGEPRSWEAPLRQAYFEPWSVADRWRAAGGRVVGVLGWTVPRELVVAAGMLPVRLSPRRLWREAPSSGVLVPDGLAPELPPWARGFLAAVLAGGLDWVDGLVLGRDTEAHTKLFFVLRELRRTGALPGGPPVAFFDLLRLPLRTSARYDRLRAGELAELLGTWAGRTVAAADLGRAVEEEAATAAAMRALDARRTAPVPSIRGSQALVVAGAARVLPGAEVRRHLSSGPAGPAASVGGPERPGLRVLVSGSGHDDPAGYEVLEEAGLCLVGEDHEWGDDGTGAPEPGPDPLGRIVDRYQLASAGAARSGLADRVARTVERVRRSGARAVIQVVRADDEASGWELPALRGALGATAPVVVAAVPAPGGPDAAVAARADAATATALRDAADRLRHEAAHG